MKVGVIDYGVGNLGSVLRALEELRVAPVLVNRAADMHATDCLILPGVGNFADCARLLHEGGWTTALRDEVQGYSRPLLGVCVGMQLLADSSTEGAEVGQGTPGLGFIPGQVQHPAQFRLRAARATRGLERHHPHPRRRAPVPRHSRRYRFLLRAQLRVRTTDPADVLATTGYGIPVTAAVRRGHVWGTQFHPEKSSRAGFRCCATSLKARHAEGARHPHPAVEAVRSGQGRGFRQLAPRRPGAAGDQGLQPARGR